MSRQAPCRRAASRIASISAWAVGSARASFSLCVSTTMSPEHEDAADRHVAGGSAGRGEFDRSGHARDVVVIAVQKRDRRVFPGGLGTRTPGRIRTADLSLRRAARYPATLRALPEAGVRRGGPQVRQGGARVVPTAAGGSSACRTAAKFLQRTRLACSGCDDVRSWAHWAPHGRLVVGLLAPGMAVRSVSPRRSTRAGSQKSSTGSEFHNRIIIGPVSLVTGMLIAVFDIHG